MIVARRFAPVFALLLLAPCSFASNDYPVAVKPIIEQRCMVCHGCYDAPCQLKLDAWAGLQRGASKEIVYDGTRLSAVKPTRLFEDAQTIEQWRQMGFYPVLDQERPGQGVMAGMLQLKQRHPLATDQKLLPAAITLGLDRDQQCVKPDAFEQYAKDYPLWGMPYGLPGLNQKEHTALMQWLQAGAPAVTLPPSSPARARQVQHWEQFFNGTSPKQQLVSRYIYEHLFIGNLYFSDLQESPSYYNLVRSRTPPGQPIDIIATRRPYDDPGVKRVYYRLQPLRSTVLAKRHMPYALNDQRMQRWQSLFFDTDYRVSDLPGYQTDVAENPFVVFQQLPQSARYKFMLDEAQFTIMGYIKGPVCRGQIALNVINDHFWVAFLNPDRQDKLENADFLARESANLRLPADKEGGAIGTILKWRKYSRDQLNYLQAKFEHIQKSTDTDGVKLDLDLIWDGDGTNDNAALTIFRHEDTASVVKGFVGQPPKTAWIIDYSLLERIHYLLVAGFDVFGNVAHQLETRLYMDFLRMEGEQNFLFFLPADRRIALRDFWYRDAREDAQKFVMTDSAAIDRNTAIEYKTARPEIEFFTLLKQRLPGATAPRYQPADPHFTELQTLRGKGFSFMPEVAFVRVPRENATASVYTVLHNTAYSNNAQIFRDAQRHIPEEDYLTVVSGYIGAYPNAFFEVPEKKLNSFVTAIEKIQSEDDYAALVSTFGVRRNQATFWPLSDKFHAYYENTFPIEAGLFDLNRYENR